MDLRDDHSPMSNNSQKSCLILVMATRNPGFTHQLRLVVFHYSIMYHWFFLHPRWLFRISEPSTVAFRELDKYMGVSKNRGTPKWMVYNGKPY